MKIVNEEAYKPNAFSKLVKLEVEVMLDAVPGAWHTPEDIMNWIASHSYVQSVTLKEETPAKYPFLWETSMAFILFETGSAKWLKSTGIGTYQFTSNRDEATPYNSSATAWTLEDAINNMGADRYKDTIVAHSLAGKPLRVRSNCNDVTIKVPIVTANDLIERLTALKENTVDSNADVVFKMRSQDLIVTNVEWNDLGDQIEVILKRED